MVHKIFLTSIVGRHAYPNVTLSPGQQLVIEPEIDNPFDAHALVVKTRSGDIVGHLKASLSLHFSKQAHSLKILRATALRTTADVTFRHPIRVVAEYY